MKRIILSALLVGILMIHVSVASAQNSRYIIGFPNLDALYQGKSQLNNMGVQIEKSSDDLQAVLVTLSNNQKQLLMSSNLDISYIEKDIPSVPDSTPNDPLYPQQWYLPATEWSMAFDHFPKQEIIIAVVDSGIQQSHPDLIGKIVNGFDFVNNDNNAEDDLGHGTIVSGIIASATNNNIGLTGANPNAKIMPIKILDSRGTGSSFDLAEGIKWATNNGAQVINISLSTGKISVVKKAVDFAKKRGVIIVASAGNNGNEEITYPAGFKDVIAVGAVDSNLNRAAFSNYGKGLDIVAPGINVLSTGISDRYVYSNGTSVSAPLVSAAVGLLLAQERDYNNAIDALFSGTTDLGVPGPDNQFGNGLLSFEKALKQPTIDKKAEKT